MTSWYLLVPVHRPYSKHLRERIVFLYVVKGCSNIATELGGQPCKRTVERIVGASCTPFACTALAPICPVCLHSIGAQLPHLLAQHWHPFAPFACGPHLLAQSWHPAVLRSQAQGSASGHGCCGLGCQTPRLAPRAAAHHSPPPPPPPLRQGLCWCWMMVWREGKVSWRACGRRMRHRAPAPSRLHSAARP